MLPPSLVGLTIPAYMYLRTNNFTVCILINARDNYSILKIWHFQSFHQVTLFQFFFALVKLTTRAHYTCVAGVLFTNLNPDFANEQFHFPFDCNQNDLPPHLDRLDWYLNLVLDFCFIQRHCFSIARMYSFIRWSMNRQTLFILLRCFMSLKSCNILNS